MKFLRTGREAGVNVSVLRLYFVRKSVVDHSDQQNTDVVDIVINR